MRSPMLYPFHPVAAGRSRPPTGDREGGVRSVLLERRAEGVEDEAEAGTPSIAVAERALGARRPRILVVDDEAAIRRLVVRALARAGFQAEEAEDGAAAVRQVAVDPAAIDLVLIDLRMPRLDGVDTLRALRGMRPTLPAVLMSGYSERGIDQDLAAHAATAFIAKPFALDALLDLVRRTMAADEGAP